MCGLNNSEISSKLYEKSECTWTLHKYTEIIREYKERTNLESPTFPEAEGKFKWKLMLHPNYYLFSTLLSLTLGPGAKLPDKIVVEYVFSLRNTKNDLIVRQEDKKIVSGLSDYVAYLTICNDKLIKLITEDDILQIEAVIIVEVPTLQPDTIGTADLTSFVKLSRDLGDMFTSGEFKDFTIKFNDKTETTVHRSILAARSPVFAAMFRHNFSENNVSKNKVGSTEIVDIDKATMMRLLTFVYTGKTKHLSKEEAINLLAVADKYEVADLVEYCSEVLKGNITESSAMDILILAEVHSVSDLKKAAIKYILANPKKFPDQKCLEKLVKYPSLLVDLSSNMLSLLRNKLGH